MEGVGALRAGGRARSSSASSLPLSFSTEPLAAADGVMGAAARSETVGDEATREVEVDRERLHLLLPRALSTPMSGDAVSSRLLQALPQLGLPHWLLDVNHRGSDAHEPSDDRANEDSSSPRSDADAATAHLLQSPRRDWATTSPRSRRRSASSIPASEASAQRIRSLGQLNVRRLDAPGIPRASSERSESSSQRDATGGSSTAGEEASSSAGPMGENPDTDDQTAIDELQTLFRRSHHSLPFLALFLVYFAYQHATGILVVVVGTIAIIGLDQRVRAQVALKDKASIFHLMGIVGMCAIDMVALCTVNGEPNPFLHFSRMLEASNNHKGAFWDVLWIVLVNDFMIRLCSLGFKAIVAAIKADRLCCRQGCAPTVSSSGSSETEAGFTGPDLSRVADNADSDVPATPRTPSSVAFYRRKRKLYGIIEMCSIFLRSLLAGIPWCSYYQLCSSQFMADVFTFAYLFVKGLVLGTQGRQIFSLVRSFVTLGLEFGAYVTPDDLAEAGSPDCSICYEPMHMPVKLSCSHMFCEECVMEWFDRERSCPLCRASVGPSTSDQEDGRPQFFDGSTSLIPQFL